VSVAILLVNRLLYFVFALFIFVCMNCYNIFSETGEVLTQMNAGNFFGEIGILNLDGGINR